MVNYNDLESKSEAVLTQDPTARTREALLREIAALKELFVSEISAARAENQHVRELHDERFTGLNTRSEEKWKDSKLAIDAALQAAEKAVNKTEITFTKQIDSTDAKINDLKDIVSKLEIRVQANESQRKGGTELWAVIVGIIGMCSGAIMVIFAILRH
jgi:hypothetical protein